MDAACSELLARDARTRDLLAARHYALYQRDLDTFPSLFAFGDVVELELAGPRRARTGVPAVVIDVLRENWLRLLVPGRWAGSSRHHMFHVRTWNVVTKQEWAGASRAELRRVVFGDYMLKLAVLAAAVFEPADFEQDWHMVVKQALSEPLEFDGAWDQRFIRDVDSATLFVSEF
jgi:hypothetical protein